MLRPIQLSILVLAIAVSGIARADQRMSTPPPQVPPDWGVPSVRVGPGQPFDCRIDMVRSWSMAGSAPERYWLVRTNENGLRQDSCRTAWRMASTPQTLESDFAVVPYSFSAQGYQGKRIRYSVVLRTEDVTGSASLVGRVDDANGKVLAFDDMRTRALVGTVPDTRYDVVLDVPESAANIMIGVVLVGRGTVWADKLRIEAVGNDVPLTDTLSSAMQSMAK